MNWKYYKKDQLEYLMQVQEAECSIYTYIPAAAFKELLSRPVKPRLAALNCLSTLMMNLRIFSFVILHQDLCD